MHLVDLRIGVPVVTEELLKLRTHWPDLENPSSYAKSSVPSVVATLSGLSGNAPGYPSHIDDSSNRAALVFNLETYEHLAKLFPGRDTFIMGGFGENFVVDHPELSPAVVCIGDCYQIGSAQFVVTGPRFPCPKVDAWHGTVGLQKHALAFGHAGYFMKVSKAGQVSKNDKIILLARKNPGYTIQRISQGLWGQPDTLETSQDFYKALISMEDLLGKGYRNVAAARLKEQQGSIAAATERTTADKISFVFSRSLLSATICASLVVLINAFNK